MDAGLFFSWVFVYCGIATFIQLIDLNMSFTMQMCAAQEPFRHEGQFALKRLGKITPNIQILCNKEKEYTRPPQSESIYVALYLT